MIATNLIKSEILSVVKECRRWVEVMANKQNNGNTAGFCAIATAKLFKELTCSIPVIISKMDKTGVMEHSFLLYESENVIIDITADQFGKEPIEIRHSSKHDGNWFWKYKEKKFWKGEYVFVTKGIYDFIKKIENRENKCWKDQRPSDYGIKLP